MPKDVNPAIQAGFIETAGDQAGLQSGYPGMDVGPTTKINMSVVGCLRTRGDGRPDVHPTARPLFRLLFWLTDAERSLQVSAASRRPPMFRARKRKRLGTGWRNPSAQQRLPVHDDHRGHVPREQWLSPAAARPPQDYLAALDEAVRAAVRNQKPPAEALAQAEAKWRDITKRLRRGTAASRLTAIAWGGSLAGHGLAGTRPLGVR